MSLEQKRTAVEPTHPEIPVSRQCELLSLSRSSYYYNNGSANEEGKSRSSCYSVNAFRGKETPVEEKAKARRFENELLMRLLDEQYLRTPHYGSRRLCVWLRRRGFKVNRKRVRRLMRLLGLSAIYPKPDFSRRDQAHKIYPYLLHDLEIDSPDLVWATDITYIRLRRGFVYLVAVMDLCSRYVLSWELSATLEVDFCVTALERALSRSCPAIFNSDQGSQFTSEAFTQVLKGAGVKISMDGRGRCFDNILIERLWRSVKYEEVYLRGYEGFTDARRSLSNYFNFYNTERYHQSLSYLTPSEVYRGIIPQEIAM